jgi:thiamine biosynthesis lipoprotein
MILVDNLLILLFFSLILGACGGSADRLPEYELSGQTMGTSYSIKLVAPDQNLDRQALGVKLSARLDEINSTMSTYRPESELSRFNRLDSTEWSPVSDELCALVADALEFSELTDGAFDVTVGPLVNLWGFGPDGDISRPPTDAAIAEALTRVGFGKLHANCDLPALRKDRADVYVDLSALAKGYAVDQSAELLETHRITDYLVEIGGELRMRGHNALGELWAIAVEKPQDDTRSVQSVVRLTDSAMATSGDYRNFFEFEGRRYSHTIHPKTGRPVTHDAAAVTVVDKSAADADALATALLVLGPEEGLALAAREGIAAYFLLRTESGIEQRTTGEFAAMVNL